jgi:hypothetical protein
MIREEEMAATGTFSWRKFTPCGYDFELRSPSETVVSSGEISP